MIFEQLGVAPVPKIPDTWDATSLHEGDVLGQPRALFSAIPASKEEEWREAYGGTAAREAKLLEAERALAKKAAKKAKEEEKRRKKAEAAKGEAAREDEVKEGLSNVRIE